MKSLRVSEAGEVLLRELEAPRADDGFITVQTNYSLISNGTEREIISNPSKRKLSSTPLGYSASGQVTDVGRSIENIKAGDVVACSGLGYATHSEVLKVPKHLFVPVPAGVTGRDAAFVTIGTIALHAVRQSKANLGETVLVIGGGLVGNVSAQICRAAGYVTMVCDLSTDRVALAEQVGIPFTSDVKDLRGMVLEVTEKRGADAVLVCAHTSDDHLMDVAIEMAKSRGRVVIVGDFPIKIGREPMFQKEIEITISRAYGPGRYDAAYEEQGIDYPYDYVRWTENRNMKEFLRLLAERKVNVSALVGGMYTLDQFQAAYDEVNSGSAKLATLFVHNMGSKDG